MIYRGHKSKPYEAWPRIKGVRRFAGGYEQCLNALIAAHNFKIKHKEITDADPIPTRVSRKVRVSA